MYKVVIVDDELSSLEFIRILIERSHPEFEVVAQAENGLEGLEMARQFKPDVLITDVKMPMMNGVELLHIVKTEYPEILGIIISGHQDFEYAKGAIQSEVCDYLLKPIDPNEVDKVLNKIALRLNKVFINNRNIYLRKLALGEVVENDILNYYFPSSGYYIVLVRRNGLPLRFNKIDKSELFSIENERVLVYSRDEMESLYLFPQELIWKSFHEIKDIIFNKAISEEGYITAVYFDQVCKTHEISKGLTTLYQFLSTHIVPGYSQELNYSETEDTGVDGIDVEEQRVLDRFCYIIENKQFYKLEKEIEVAIYALGEKKCNQLKMEIIIKYVLYQLRKYIPDINTQNIEIMVEELFYYANSLEQIIVNLQNLFGKSFSGERDSENNLVNYDFFCMILDYIDSHITKELSLNAACEKFKISQPVLSKLFRNYKGISFNTYLTTTRMNYAKKIMEMEPDLYVKQVASKVGYQDQFYFSRVFKTFTGQSPSEYIDEVKNKTM